MLGRNKSQIGFDNKTRCLIADKKYPVREQIKPCLTAKIPICLK
ncbi:hypothetical protein C1O63_0104 [Dehalococcoides mccartyi]|nr:hypothetical protein C1O63_0104 [Dehalococcoides mccartyi]